MDDKEEIELADISIAIDSNEYWNDMITVTGGTNDISVDYEDWLAQYNGTIDLSGIDIGPYSYPGSSLGANDIKLTAAGDEMLRVAQDGFYVRGVRVEADAKEAKAVYKAFKQWMTYAILNGEINN
jgi:hypothetical protein